VGGQSESLPIPGSLEAAPRGPRQLIRTRIGGISLRDQNGHQQPDPGSTTEVVLDELIEMRSEGGEVVALQQLVRMFFQLEEIDLDELDDELEEEVDELELLGGGALDDVVELEVVVLELVDEVLVVDDVLELVELDVRGAPVVPGASVVPGVDGDSVALVTT